MKKVFREVFSSILLSCTVATPPSLAASSNNPFSDFQNICLAMTDGNPATHPADVVPLPVPEVEAFIKNTGVSADTLLWESSAPGFVVQTYHGDEDYCFMFAGSADFLSFQRNYETWREGNGSAFITSGPLEMRTIREKPRAGVFMVMELGEDGFQQVSIQFHPERKGLVVTMVSIRLNDLSPAAKELLDRRQSD